MRFSELRHLQSCKFDVVGVYSTGPIWGRMVDRRGPTMALVLACLFLFTGYSGIRTVYDTGLPTDGGADFAEGELPQTRLILLVLCGFLSGAGGNGGLTAAINTTAKSFPDRTVRPRTYTHRPPCLPSTRSAQPRRGS